MTELKKISILTLGLRGDVQPYLALAIVLKEKGYIVRFISHANFQEMIESYGIGFCSICPDSRMLLDRKEVMQGKYTHSIMLAMGHVYTKWSPNIVRLCHQEFKQNRPDLIIKGTGVEFLVYQAALNEKIPFIDTGYNLLIYNPNHCVFGFPTLPFGLHKVITNYLIPSSYYDRQMMFDKALQQMDTDGNMGIASKSITKSEFLARVGCPRLPKLIFVSPLIPPLLYPRAESIANLKFVGYSVVPQAKQISGKKDDEFFVGSTTKHRLEEFLSQDNKDDCVYIGWGSMVSGSPQHMTELAVRALRQCGQRGIIGSGYAGLSLDRLQESQNLDNALLQYAKENVIFVDEVPHEWLFSRVRATVHHGGAGTTAAAFRSGKPTVVTPVFYDQWDHAYLVNQLQCGYGFEKTQLQSLTWQELGNAIERVLSDPNIVERAREVGKELENENGAETAAFEVERYWKEYIETGRFEESWSTKKEPDTLSSGSLSLLGLAVVGAAAALGGWFLYTEKLSGEQFF